jgi:hypothetical protein
VTVQILKSHIQDEGAFCYALEKLRQAKVDHMMGGEIGTSPPSDSFLDQFIKRTPTGPDTPDDISIDYEIVDDTPPPPSEAEVRAKALADLRTAEAAEIEAVLPQHKRRLFEMTAQRANARISSAQIKGEPLSAEDEAIVKELAAINEAITEIQYAYAKREAEL